MTSAGYRCPADPNHGYLLQLATSSPNDMYCPHTDHSGRPKTHPLGPAEPTRNTFNITDVDQNVRLTIARQAKAARITRRRAATK